MSDRDYIRMRATSDREYILEQAKERMGTEGDAETFDEALRRAISFEDLLEELRGEIVARGKELNMEYHSLNVRTSISSRK